MKTRMGMPDPESETPRARRPSPGNSRFSSRLKWLLVPVLMPVVFSLSAWADQIITFMDLNPAGASDSAALAVRGTNQAGWVVFGTNQPHAALWRGSSNSCVDLHPAGAFASQIQALTDTQQGGIIFALAGGSSVPHAALWSGTANSFVDLNPATSSSSYVYGMDSTNQVGAADYSGPFGMSLVTATFWSGSSNSCRGLNPVGSTAATAYALSGSQAGGWFSTKHAAWWPAISNSCVDLNPAGAASSCVYGISGTNQIGVAVFAFAFYSTNHAALWSGSSNSFVDLNPAGADGGSAALAASGSQQAGYAVFSGQVHAALWSGSAASFVDLHATLSAGYTGSTANGIWSNGSTTYVVGQATLSSGNTNAIMWTIRQESPPQGLLLVRPVCAGTNFNFSFQTVTDASYTVEFNNDLGTTNWRSLETVIGDGSPMSCCLPMTNTTPCFFRVRQQ